MSGAKQSDIDDPFLTPDDILASDGFDDNYSDEYQVEVEQEFTRAAVRSEVE